jgi:hypothetical protein
MPKFSGGISLNSICGKDRIHWALKNNKGILLMTAFYEMEMESITGETVSFSDYRDQVLLIVNLASQ